MAKDRKSYSGAEGFIENMRKKAVPTYHTAADATQGEPEVRIYEPIPSVESHKQEKTEQTDTLVPSSVENQEQPRMSETEMPDFMFEKTFDNIDLTEMEKAYITDFITRGRFKSVNRGGSQVVIREKYREIIKNVFSLLGKNCNMAVYIDNVLTEHFKKYYPTIVGIYRKSPPKF